MLAKNSFTVPDKFCDHPEKVKSLIATKKQMDELLKENEDKIEGS